ncbi:RNase H domain-containing protein [Trichonephila clavata]|uniref:RNase H domain-containing protein n=1 Tax=Trichonephila clavata TaxID=2740835 RepID=A0A8X6H0F4_TRICU|nr:RNase H domain-containing protein [Trichonephila clavata]
MSRSYNSWKQNMGANNSELHNISFAAALFGSGNPKKACPEAQTVETQNVTNPRWISYSPMNRFVTHQPCSKFGHFPTLKQGESLKASLVIPSSSIPLSNYNQIPYFNFENSNRCNQVINFFTTPLSSKSGKGPFGTLELKGKANVGQESPQVKIKDDTIKIRRKSFSETRIVTDFNKKSVFSVKTTTWNEATVIAQEENEASNLIQSLAAVKNTSTSKNSNGGAIKIEISSGKRNYTERCQSSPEVVNKNVELKPSYPGSTKDSEKFKENIMEEIHEERRLLLEEIKKFFAFYHPEYENSGLKVLPHTLKLMNDNTKGVPENSLPEFNFRNQTEVMSGKKINEDISQINLEHISVPTLDKLLERVDNVLECEKPKVSDDGFQNSPPFERNVKETGSKEEIMQPEVPPLTFTNLLLNDQLCNLEANRSKKTFLLRSFKGITANQDRNSEPFSVESADVGHFNLNNSNKVQNNTACLPLLSNPTHQSNEKSVENEDRKDLCENLNLSKLEEQENEKNTNVSNDASPSSFIPAPQRGKMIEVSTSSSEFWELDSWLTSTSESLSNGTFGSNASDTTNAIHFSSSGDKKSFENISGPRRETLGMENIRSESDDENRKSFESYESRSASSIDILSRALNANLSMSECADENQKNSSFALSDTTGGCYPKMLRGRDYMYLNMPLNCSRNDENKIYNYTRLNSGKLGENPNFSARPKSKKEFRYRLRNPDNRSVFRSELVAIREALNLALDNRASDTWILTDSKSCIQFLKDWSNVLDMLGQDILLKLAALTQVSSVCFQWIPWHVGIYVNEIADLLSREANELPTASSSELQTSVVHSLFTGKIKNIWRSPPKHACMPLSVRDCPCSAPVLELLSPLYLDLGLVNNYLNNKLNFPIPSSASGTSENLGSFTFSAPIYNFIDSSDVCDSNSCSNTVEEFSGKNNSFSKWCYDYDSSYCKTSDSFVSSNSTQNFVLLQDSPRPYGSEMAGDARSSNLSNLNLSVSSLNISVESISSQNSASDSCLVTSSSSEDENEQKLEQKQLKFGEPRTATTSTEFSKEAILSSEEDGSFEHRAAKPFANSLLSQAFSKDFSNNCSRGSESRFKLKRVPSRKTINKRKFENGCLYWLKQKRMKNVNHNESIEYVPISISKKNNCKCRSLKIKFIMPSKAPKSLTGDQLKNYVNTSANHKGPSTRKQQQGNGDPHSAGDVCNGFCSQEIKKVLLEQLSTNEVLSQIGLRVCAYETPVEVLVSTPKKNKKGAYHKILTLCGYED